MERKRIREREEYASFVWNQAMNQGANLCEANRVYAEALEGSFAPIAGNYRVHTAPCIQVFESGILRQ